MSAKASTPPEMVPKFWDEGLLVVRAGGEAGLFSPSSPAEPAAVSATSRNPSPGRSANERDDPAARPYCRGGFDDAPRRAPLESLEDKTVALMDIGKMRGDEFIDRLEELSIATSATKELTNTRTAPLELQKIAKECYAVVIALTDCGSCTSCSTHDLLDLDRRDRGG